MKKYGFILLSLFMSTLATAQIAWMGDEYTALNINSALQPTFYLGDDVSFEIQSNPITPNQGAQVYIGWGNDGNGGIQNEDWFGLNHISNEETDSIWNRFVRMRQVGTHNRKYLGWHTCYSNCDTANMGAFTVLPLGVPTGFSIMCQSTDSSLLSWQKWNTQDVLILRKTYAFTPDDEPVQGTTYNQGNTVGGATVLYRANATFASTAPGTKRLRIRSVLADVPINASHYVTTIDYGETEDYNLNVVVACTGVGWANLQFPASGTVCAGSPFTAYGRIYVAGVTEAAGQGAGIEAQFGYSTSNTNPSGTGWTWNTATFNEQRDNNDEFQYEFTPSTAGTYYYTFRYRTGPGCPWYYGGYNAGGGGQWGVNNNVSGVLTVDAVSVAGTASSSVTGVCAGGSVTLSLTGHTGDIQWQYSHDGGDNFYDISGSGTTATPYVDFPSQATHFRAKVTNGSCVEVYSSPVAVDYITPVTYAGLKTPEVSNICADGEFITYGQVYKAGVTNTPNHQGDGIEAQFGYSTSDTDPSGTGWTWVDATFNPEGGGNNNDEYMYAFFPPVGTYYYNFRFKTGNCDWVYGGYSNSGGGFWNGTTNVNAELTAGATTVFENGNWSTPPTDKNFLAAEIKSSFESTGDINACSIWVKDGSSANFNAGHNLIVNNEVKVDANSGLTIQSDANLIQDNDNAVNQGSITSQRETVPRYKNGVYAGYEFNYISSPVSGQNMNSLYGGDPANTLTVRKLDEPSNMFVNAPLNDPDFNIPAKGFAVRVPVKSFVDANDPVLAEFKGEPHNGVVTVDVTREASNRGWNLIGNPYPSNIDLVTLYDNDGNSDAINPDFRFWDNTVNAVYEYVPNYQQYSYAMFNPATGTNGVGVRAPGHPAGQGGTGASDKEPTRYVSAGQAFLVRTKQASATETYPLTRTVTFRNGVRTKETAGATFFGKGSESEDDLYRLQLINSGNIALTQSVVHWEGGDNGFGIEDTRHPGLYASDTFYSMIGEEKTIINGRESLVSTDVIPLGYKAFVSGNFEIRMITPQGVFVSSQAVYLRDKELNTYTDLTKGGYQFTTEAGEFTNRFEIVYDMGETLGTDGVTVPQKLLVYRHGTDFVVKSPVENVKEVEVYDMSGRLQQTKRGNDRELRIPAERLINGIYILKITLENGEVQTKKVRKD